MRLLLALAAPLRVLTRALCLVPRSHIFPVLAKRMPQFAVEHQEEHDTIHEGMDRLQVRPSAPSPLCAPRRPVD